jgi:hypothetical protein
MRLSMPARAFLDGFAPGFFGQMRRPEAPEFLFAQDAEGKSRIDETDRTSANERVA